MSKTMEIELGAQVQILILIFLLPLFSVFGYAILFSNV